MTQAITENMPTSPTRSKTGRITNGTAIDEIRLTA
jgi:hypothetical protein